MHASEQVDLAALVALGGRRLIDTHDRLDENALHTYWSASRCRLDRWGRSLRAVGSESIDSPPHTGELWEEILVGEIPTRIVSAFFVAHDQRYGRDEAGPIGRNVLYGHIDARRRAIGQIDAAMQSGDLSATQCSELYARAARWNDVLLAYLMPLGKVEEFAVDVTRARDFAFDASEHSGDAQQQVATAFLRTSLRLALQPIFNATGFSGDLNAQIACGLAGCFQSDEFASFGHLNSAWLHRMERAADDTIMMVEDLMAAE
jgi:hypothetical protein